MAVRHFDGFTDYLQVSGGAIGGNYNKAKASSILAVIEPRQKNTGADCALMTVLVGSSSKEAMFLPSAGTTDLQWGDDDPGNSTNAVLYDFPLNAWYIMAFTKASGSATFRAHMYAIALTTWHRNDSASSVSDAASGTAIDTVTWGAFTPGVGHNMYRLAVAAVWNGTQLSDAQLNTVASALSTQSVYALSPNALWEFNQASVGTSVTDLMGGGANQKGISGTSVVTGDDPTWTFGLGAPEIDHDFPKLPKKLMMGRP